MSSKWDTETTTKFIQLYKNHPCLWHFQSPDHRIKQKRDGAYDSIVQEMNITGFGAQEVKNKIKNLRSTYLQENKKIQDSKKSGAGLNNVYISNIKWLTEMEEVFSKDLKRDVYENNRRPPTDETGSQNNSSATSCHSNNDQQIPVTATTTSTTATSTSTIATTTSTTATTTTTTATTGNTVRAKKRNREIFQAVSDLKKLNENVNSENETVFEVFGRSVALQLTNLSAENALLAQNRIQNILTEFGIKDLKQKTYDSTCNHSYQRPFSAYSDASNASFHTDFYISDESYAEPSPINETFAEPSLINQATETYTEPRPINQSQPVFVVPSSPVNNVNATLNSVSTNDIVAAAMFAALGAEERPQN